MYPPISVSPLPRLAHSYGLRQHERARKLHFTTYGWSTLTYGQATLHTSTVQMLILLQFNKNKVRREREREY